MALTPHISNAFRDVQRAMLDLEHIFGGLPGALTPSVFNRAGSRYPTTNMVETKDLYSCKLKSLVLTRRISKWRSLIVMPSYWKALCSKNTRWNPPTTSADKQEDAEGTSDTQEVTTTASDKEKQVAQASYGHQWWVQERVPGSFLRSFHLPINIDPQSIKASCANGVLKVTIPKAESKGSIAVNIG